MAIMQVFDRAHFETMTAGDRALQHEVIALFRQQTAAWAQACEGDDWRAAVHTMKGSARGIGLHALAYACEAAECAGADRSAVSVALEQALAALDQFAAAEPRAVSR
ncbi:MAG: Hpt domain-containing protein [Hyphomonadaceae bacterium]|nr:Hpt domain-containing protein [Hyphomonadaceae bacterium]